MMSEEFDKPPVFGALYEIANTYSLFDAPSTVRRIGTLDYPRRAVGQVHAHDLVVVLDRNKSWYKILTPEGIVGWAYIVGVDTGLKLYEPT